VVFNSSKDVQPLLIQGQLSVFFQLSVHSRNDKIKNLIDPKHFFNSSTKNIIKARGIVKVILCYHFYYDKVQLVNITIF